MGDPTLANAAQDAAGVTWRTAAGTSWRRLWKASLSGARARPAAAGILL